MLFGERIGALQLAQDLRLAHDHRIQAGGHAEQVADRVRTVVVIQVGRDPARLHAARFRQKLVHRIDGIARFLGRNRNLHAIAGRKNHAFHHARPLAQTVESFRQ